MPRYACVDKILSGLCSPAFAGVLIKPCTGAAFLNDLASAPAAGQIIVRWRRTRKRPVNTLFDCPSVPILFRVAMAGKNLKQYLTGGIMLLPVQLLIQAGQGRCVHAPAGAMGDNDTVEPPLVEFCE